jgi:hypothetical protein
MIVPAFPEVPPPGCIHTGYYKSHSRQSKLAQKLCRVLCWCWDTEVEVVIFLSAIPSYHPTMHASPMHHTVCGPRPVSIVCQQLVALASQRHCRGVIA